MRPSTSFWLMWQNFSRGMSSRRPQHNRRFCAMEPPFATPRASQEKGACASVDWFNHRLGAVTSTWNTMVRRNMDKTPSTGSLAFPNQATSKVRRILRDTSPICPASTNAHVYRASPPQRMVPTGTDNTATEAGLNKKFTSKWPSSHFLRLISTWAHARGVALQTTHVSGRNNMWAEELSTRETPVRTRGPHYATEWPHTASA